MQDYRVPRKYLRELAGIPEATLRNLISNNPEIAANESGYPVFGVMRALNKALQNQEIEIDGETLDLEKNAKYEKMLKDRITNQTKMGLLIPKEAAKKRIMKAFEAVARKIKYSIKFVSPHLIGIQSKKIIEEKKAMPIAEERIFGLLAFSWL